MESHACPLIFQAKFSSLSPSRPVSSSPRVRCPPAQPTKFFRSGQPFSPAKQPATSPRTSHIPNRQKRPAAGRKATVPFVRGSVQSRGRARISGRPAGEIPCICSTATATHPPGRAACDSKGTNGTSSPSRLATILLHSGSSDPFWGARSSFLSLVGKIGGAGFILLPADADADCLLVLSASLTIQHMHESYGFSRVAIFWAKSRGQKRSTVSD